MLIYLFLGGNVKPLITLDYKVHDCPASVISYKILRNKISGSFFGTTRKNVQVHNTSPNVQ